MQWPYSCGTTFAIFYNLPHNNQLILDADNPEFSKLPSFLFGQSMGGAVALKVHLKQPDAWNGAILVAPMCKVLHQAHFLIRLQIFALTFLLNTPHPSLKMMNTIYTLKKKWVHLTKRWVQIFVAF